MVVSRDAKRGHRVRLIKWASAILMIFTSLVGREVPPVGGIGLWPMRGEGGRFSKRDDVAVVLFGVCRRRHSNSG